MNFFKILAFAQALIIVYLFDENIKLKEQILSSAEAITKATEKIEKLNHTLQITKRAEQECRYVLNKYNEQELHSDTFQ